MEKVGNPKSRKSWNIGIWKKQEIRQSRKSDKVGNWIKKEIGKSRKAEKKEIKKEGNKKLV